jgi:hypothetical protein
MSSRSIAFTPAIRTRDLIVPVESTAYSQDAWPSLWTQKMPGVRRLATIPLASAISDGNLPVTRASLQIDASERVSGGGADRPQAQDAAASTTINELRTE